MGLVVVGWLFGLSGPVNDGSNLAGRRYDDGPAGMPGPSSIDRAAEAIVID
jgi:hypothetical protein